MIVVHTLFSCLTDLLSLSFHIYANNSNMRSGKLLHQVTISRCCKILVVEVTAESAYNNYSTIMDKIFETP